MPYIKQYSALHPKELRQLNYKRQYKLEHPSWDDSMVLLTKRIAERLPPNAAVLDLGCGHGNFVIDELLPRFSRRVGLDVSSDTTAGNRSVTELVHGTIEQLPFPDATFDIVLSLWVLEHVANPQLVFNEVARVLKPGGFFAFVTPNRGSALISLRRLMNKSLADRLLWRLYARAEDDVFPVHYRCNTLSDLKTLAANSSLNVDFLHLNPDPSYTSFGQLSYRLSSTLSSISSTLTRPHIIGVMRK